MFYMKFAGRVLALFAAVCIFCTASGCLDASTTPSEGGGITAVDLPEPEGLTLAEALAELDLLGAEGGLNVTGASAAAVEAVAAAGGTLTVAPVLPAFTKAVRKA